MLVVIIIQKTQHTKMPLVKLPYTFMAKNSLYFCSMCRLLGVDVKVRNEHEQCVEMSPRRHHHQLIPAPAPTVSLIFKCLSKHIFATYNLTTVALVWTGQTENIVNAMLFEILGSNLI